MFGAFIALEVKCSSTLRSAHDCAQTMDVDEEGELEPLPFKPTLLMPCSTLKDALRQVHSEIVATDAGLHSIASDPLVCDGHA